MKILVDTHLLIWAGYRLPQLSKRARALIENPDNTLLFSAASIWEMAIKQALGREDFDVDVVGLRKGLLENNYQEVAVTSEHAVAVASLPMHHRDPFDRLLIAQAQIEKTALLTADKRLSAYGLFIVKV